MPNYARLEGNRVSETLMLEEGQDITQMFPPTLIWVPCPDEAQEGWVYFNGLVVPPDYYQVLRAAEYPPIQEFVDAQVKLASPDPEVQARGQAQLDAYFAACLAVKEKYPAPV